MASLAFAHTGHTGPRTPQGKAVSSQNATTHGLSSHTVVLPHEDRMAFERMAGALHAGLGAKGAHEIFLVGQMAENQWRLNRLRRIETALMDQLLLGSEPGPSPEARMAKALIDRGGDPLDKIERYAAAAERAYFRARRELTTYRKVQNELDLQARQIADHENYLHRRAENEERFLGIPNPYTAHEPDENFVGQTSSLRPISNRALPGHDDTASFMNAASVRTRAAVGACSPTPDPTDQQNQPEPDDRVKISLAIPSEV